MTLAQPEEEHVSLYAELLLNIKSLAVFVTLPHQAIAGQYEAEISNSSQFTLIEKSFNNRVASLSLPHPHVGQNLLVPAVNGSQLTFRLSPKTDHTLAKLQTDTENYEPWSAPDLEELQPHIGCRDCKRSLVNKDALRSYYALPSEGWAEMMDFWHCHKPNHPANDDSSAQQKGYAADNSTQARAGRCAVGMTYLLLHEEDCRSVERASADESEPAFTALLCANCKAVVGEADALAGFKLYKWSLQMMPIRSGDIQTLLPVALEKWMTVQILMQMENQGVRHFLLPRGHPQVSQDLLIWVLTSDMWYTRVHKSSQSDTPVSTDQPKRCIKALWKYIESHSSTVNTSTEELNLPHHLHDDLIQALQRNQEILPPGARIFNGYNVSVLHRFKNGR